MERFRIAEGITAAAEVGGEPGRPPVILLHGGGQTRHSWGNAARALVSAGYHVISLDARGHGDSDWSPSGNYRLDAFAEDLKKVIDTLDSLPVLVGASLGGATILHALGHATRPLARAVVLVDIVPRVEEEGAKKILEFMRSRPHGFTSVEEAADTVSEYYPNRPRPKDPSGLMKNLRRRSDGRFYWHWDPRLMAKDETAEPPAIGDDLLMLCNKIKIPALLVRGLQSDIVSDNGIRELQTQMPQLEVMDVAGAGHMVAGDKNDLFNNGVIGFLLRHFPPSGPQVARC